MKNHIGEKFGRLTIVQKTNKKVQRTYLYECMCECGNTTYARMSDLKSGHVQSCGCLQIEKAKDQAASFIVDGTKPSGFNGKPNKNNGTGYRGVSAYQQSGKTKYSARLYYKGENHQCKGFKTAEEAYKARLEMEKKYLPENIKNK